MPSAPTDVFPLGKPVRAEDLVDREDFIDRLVDRLRDGQSAIIASPRRTGKSSVAQEVLRRLHRRGAYTAAVDVFLASSQEQLGALLLHAILRNRDSRLKAMVRNAWRELRDILARARLQTRFKDLELELVLDRHDPDPEALLLFAFETAERMAERDGRRMVIMLDEFQELADLGDPALLKRLRAVFQHQRHVTYLFLGSKPAIMRSIFADRRQAFDRFALLLDLPPIPDEAWREYLRRKFASLGMEVKERALDILLERTGGHPYSVMAVASAAYYGAKHEAHRATIDADRVQVAWEEALDSLSPVYQADWESVRSHRHAAAVLEAIAQGRGPYIRGLKPQQVTKVLRFLERSGLIERGDRRGSYRIVEPMFAWWIRERLP